MNPGGQTQFMQEKQTHNMQGEKHTMCRGTNTLYAEVKKSLFAGGTNTLYARGTSTPYAGKTNKLYVYK